MSNELTVHSALDVNSSMQLARSIAQSTLVPRALKNESDALVVILTGQELGLPPMTALRSIHVVDGKPTMSADLMVALCKRSGECIFFDPVEVTNKGATFRTQRKGSPEPTVFTYTEEDASAAGLLRRKGPWQQHRKAMYAARCKAMLARLVYPDLLVGVYDADSGEIEESAQNEYIEAEVVQVDPQESASAMKAIIDVLRDEFRAESEALDAFMSDIGKPMLADMSPDQLRKTHGFLTGPGRERFSAFVTKRSIPSAVRMLAGFGLDDSAANLIARGTQEKHGSDALEFWRHIQSHGLREILKAYPADVVRKWIESEGHIVDDKNIGDAIKTLSLEYALEGEAQLWRDSIKAIAESMQS